MSSKEFWKLSFYEWSIWLLRIRSQQEKRKQDMELLIELERNSMALFANANRDPKKTGPFSGKDFYPLSYDQITDEVEKVTGESMFNLLIEKFKNKPIRKRG